MQSLIWIEGWLEVRKMWFSSRSNIFPSGPFTSQFVKFKFSRTVGLKIGDLKKTIKDNQDNKSYREIGDIINQNLSNPSIKLNLT